MDIKEEMVKIKKSEAFSKIKAIPELSVHAIQAHSYTFYFIMLLIGISLDAFFRIDIPYQNILMPISVVLLILASVLIIWAQNASKKFKKENTKENITKESFLNGPYSFTKNPTHWGLFILMLGFGILANALFIILSTIISFIVTKLVFLKKEEIILADKYGDPYLEYKKSVKL